MANNQRIHVENNLLIIDSISNFTISINRIEYFLWNVIADNIEYSLVYDRVKKIYRSDIFTRKIDKGCFLFFFFDTPYRLIELETLLTTVDDGKWIIRSAFNGIIIIHYNAVPAFKFLVHPSKSWRVVARNWFKTESVIYPTIPDIPRRIYARLTLRIFAENTLTEYYRRSRDYKQWKCRELSF